MKRFRNQVILVGRKNGYYFREYSFGKNCIIILINSRSFLK